jgi:phosphohistidine swiveling domain-containing protein
MRYPKGVAILPETIREIIDESTTGSTVMLEKVGDEVMQQFPEYGKGLQLSVRSSPPSSMPGILSTVLNVGSADIDLEGAPPVSDPRGQLLAAIRSVALEWNSDRAVEFRQVKEVPDDPTQGIVVQQMVFGNLNDRSGTGVAFSRDPNTGKKKLAGSYIINAQGKALVSGERPGTPLEDMKSRFPGAYVVLQDMLPQLEAFLGWPQEVEFTVENDEIYFLQTRDIRFAPAAGIKYLNRAVDEGIMTEEQRNFRLPDFIRRGSQRKIYVVKDGIPRTVIGKGQSATPGAMAGEIVFSYAEAVRLHALGRRAIIIARDRSEDVVRHLFTLPEVGLITAYGDESDHEAVLTREAGVPSIINVDEEVLRQLKPGMKVVIDGDANEIFITPDTDAALVEDRTIIDASYGINFVEFKHALLKEAFGDSAISSDDIDEELLYVLNEVAQQKYRASEAAGDSKAIFRTNMEKDILHILLKTRKKTLSGPEKTKRNRISAYLALKVYASLTSSGFPPDYAHVTPFYRDLQDILTGAPSQDRTLRLDTFNSNFNMYVFPDNGQPGMYVTAPFPEGLFNGPNIMIDNSPQQSSDNREQTFKQTFIGDIWDIPLFHDPDLKFHRMEGVRVAEKVDASFVLQDALEKKARGFKQAGTYRLTAVSPEYELAGKPIVDYNIIFVFKEGETLIKISGAQHYDDYDEDIERIIRVPEVVAASQNGDDRDASASWFHESMFKSPFLKKAARRYRLDIAWRVETLVSIAAGVLGGLALAHGSPQLVAVLVIPVLSAALFRLPHLLQGKKVYASGAVTKMTAATLVGAVGVSLLVTGIVPLTFITTAAAAVVLALVRREHRKTDRPDLGDADAVAAVKKALSGIGASGIMSIRALADRVLPESRKPLILSVAPYLKDMNYAISESRNSEYGLIRGRGLAGLGFHVFMSMPLDGMSTKGMKNITKAYSDANLGDRYAQVWAKRIPTEKGSLVVFYYEPAQGAAAVDSRWFGRAIWKLLADNPSILKKFGLKGDVFKVGVYETDTPLGHPALVNKEADDALDDAVIVLRNGGDIRDISVSDDMAVDAAYVKEVKGRKLFNLVRAAKRFDVVLGLLDDPFAKLKEIEAKRKQKDEVKYVKGEPLNSVTVELSRNRDALQQLRDDAAIEELLREQVDTVVFRGLPNKMDAKTLDELARTVKKLHDKGIRVFTDYVLIKGEDITRAQANIAARMKVGTDGVRADFMHTTGNIDEAAEKIARTVLRANGDGLAGMILHDGVELQNGSVYREKIIPVVRFQPEDERAKEYIAKGRWVEMAREVRGGTYHYEPKGKDFEQDYSKLLKAPHVEIVGMDYEILRAGSARLGYVKFRDLLREFMLRRKSELANDTGYRYRTEYWDAFGLDAKAIPASADAFYDLLKGSPDQFLRNLGIVYTKVLPENTDARRHIQYLLEDYTKNAGDAEQEKVFRSAAQGYVEGLLARIELKNFETVTIENGLEQREEPLLYRQDREMMGWALMQARQMGIEIPADLKDKSFEEKQAFYENLVARFAAGIPAGSAIDRVLKDAAEINRRLRDGGSFGEVSASVREITNDLYAISRSAEGKKPVVIVAMLEMIDLFSDRDVKVFNKMKRNALEVMPAVQKAILAAA